jgi:hypothetical protein
MTTSTPAYTNNSMGDSQDRDSNSAYHRRADSDDRATLAARLEEAVENGRITRSQANSILVNWQMRHNTNR